MKFRILFNFIVFLSVFFAPFWVSLILGIVGIIYFNYYWEVVVLMLISDLFFGTSQIRYGNVVYLNLVLFVAMLTGIEFLKRKMNLNK